MGYRRNVRQVLRAGGDYALIHRRAKAGVWIRLDRTVYGLPGNPGTWERQVKVAELGHPSAVVSGGAAATLHGMPDFRPGRPEITVPANCNHRTVLATVRSRDHLTTTRIQGFRTTDVAQTLLDLAPITGHQKMTAAVEDSLLRRRVEPDTFLTRCREEGLRRLRGAGRLGAIVEDLTRAGPLAESELERRLRHAYRQAGLTDVRYQEAPPWFPEGRERVDALLPAHRVIIQADGLAWHARMTAFERDRWRRPSPMARTAGPDGPPFSVWLSASG